MLPIELAERTNLTELFELAELYGVEKVYENAMKERCTASPEALVRVLRILGAPIKTAADAPDAIIAWKREHWSSPVEPVAIAWDDQPNFVELRVPKSRAAGIAEATLKLESGEERKCSIPLSELPTTRRASVGGVEFVAKRWKLPDALPLGNHELRVEGSGLAASCLVVAAPRRGYDPDAGRPRRIWGTFLPLYALHSKRSWGSGDFTNLKEFADWVGSQGGEVVGTLPLLAQLLDEPFEPSPYSPASRLFWNEAYLDLEAIPEFKTDERAQAIVRSPDFQHELAALRAAKLVDYRRQLKLKRRMLEALASTFFKNSSAARRAAYEAFLKSRPDAEDYACFRAVMERRREPWTSWPEPLASGVIRDGDYDPAVRDYYLYVQFLAAEQMQATAAGMRAAGVNLYLDLPLGVHGWGYDVWREREAFAVGAAGGCPPDIVFRNGQDWGFPPMHPTGVRKQRYRYVIAYLRHQLQHAGMLRIDHMPVFHRLFWVPQGMPARDGVYVRYPAEELYAIFNLESHRHHTLLVGEDLGTVPPEVPVSMQRHNVHGMYVVQYALQPNEDAPLSPPPHTCVASLNTHDMPPFAAYLAGQDIREREALKMLGDLDPADVTAERDAIVAALTNLLDVEPSDKEPTAAILAATLRYLSTGPARTLLLNLEDLWCETASQNLPGTSDPLANWCRKARYSLEEFTTDPRVAAIIRDVRKRSEK